MVFCRLKKTLTNSQFIDRSQDEESDDEDEIIETDEELRKLHELYAKTCSLNIDSIASMCLCARVKGGRRQSDSCN